MSWMTFNWHSLLRHQVLDLSQNTMNDKLLVALMTCIMVVNSQSTISAGEFVQCDDLKSDIESIRQLLMTQQQASGCKECQAIEEIKSQIQEIRDVIQQQNQPRQGCPPGFNYLPEVGSCFTLIPEPMNWDTATERCRQVMPGVHLAAITSQAENDAVVRYLQLHSSIRNNACANSKYQIDGNMIWIGGQTRNPRRCGDPYFWKPLKGIEIPFNYTNWNSGNPDCYQSNEHCVQLKQLYGYTWNDINCALLSCAICEIHV